MANRWSIIIFRDNINCLIFFLGFNLGFPGGSDSKEFTCNAGDLGSIPGLGRSPGERKDYPLQCSVPENSMDCIVHGVKKSQIRLSNFHFTSRQIWDYVFQLPLKLGAAIWPNFAQWNMKWKWSPFQMISLKSIYLFSTLLSAIPCSEKWVQKWKSSTEDGRVIYCF